jgi:hypothetical protein
MPVIRLPGESRDPFRSWLFAADTSKIKMDPGFRRDDEFESPARGPAALQVKPLSRTAVCLRGNDGDRTVMSLREALSTQALGSKRPRPARTSGNPIACPSSPLGHVVEHGYVTMLKLNIWARGAPERAKESTSLSSSTTAAWAFFSSPNRMFFSTM